MCIFLWLYHFFINLNFQKGYIFSNYLIDFTNEPLAERIEFMDIKTVEIAADRAVGSEKTQLIAECELVADSKPAIDKVLKASAKILIDKKEVMEDKINFKGRMLAEALYISQKDKKIHSLSGESNINDFVDIKGAKDGMLCDISVNISNVDHNMINDRKITVSAMADANARLYEKTNIDAVALIEDLPEQQQKFCTINTDVTVAEVNENFSINEEVVLPLSKPPIDEVLSIDANIVNPEYIPREDSVDVKGSVAVTLLYNTAEASLPEIYEFDLPMSGNIAAEGTREDMSVDGSFNIDSIEFDVDNDESGENRNIDITIKINTDFKVKKHEQNSVLEDAYSINNDINTDIVRICCDYVVCKNKSQYPVKETVTLDADVPDMLQIFNTGGTPYIDEIKIEDNRVVIDGIINTDIMYVTGNDESPIYSYNSIIPFSQTIDARGADSDMTADVNAEIAHIGFNMLSDREVEVRCALNTNTVVTKQVCYDIPISADICPIDDETIANMPSIVIYRVKKGDTLWKLAKRFNSTVDDIAKINKIENPDLIYPNQKLVIVKRVGE